MAPVIHTITLRDDHIQLLRWAVASPLPHLAPSASVGAVPIGRT